MAWGGCANPSSKQSRGEKKRDCQRSADEEGSGTKAGGERALTFAMQRTAESNGGGNPKLIDVVRMSIVVVSKGWGLRGGREQIVREAWGSGRLGGRSCGDGESSAGWRALSNPCDLLRRAK
jgi:hypothetical protein